ncbi:unnamed protein product [Vicia faba]|uniref:Uncharacterized protein n=1 Tax=Vicia faba TaxID=3906 RepID=A0AAV0YXG5_VICFA|nr:unnamed protein product [Vicia faba]
MDHLFEKQKWKRKISTHPPEIPKGKRTKMRAHKEYPRHRFKIIIIDKPSNISGSSFGPSSKSQGNDKTSQGYVPWKVVYSSTPPPASLNALPSTVKAYLDICIDGIMYVAQVREERLMAQFDVDVVEARAREDFMMARLAKLSRKLLLYKRVRALIWILTISLPLLTHVHPTCHSEEFISSSSLHHILTFIYLFSGILSFFLF